MLCITVKPKESVMIANGTIVVKLLKIKDGQVHLGFDAPLEIDIVREKLWLRSRDMKALEELRND